MAEETYTSIFATIVLAIGFITTLLISEALGAKDVGQPRVENLKRRHRTLGLIFAVGFIMMVSVMLTRLEYWPGEVEARIVAHWGLSIAVIGFLIAKITIARRYPRLLSFMPALGWSLLLSLFVLVNLTAGYNSIRWVGGLSKQAHRDYARALTEYRCAHCHSLERVYALQGTTDEIRSIVERMRAHSPDWIQEDEVDFIAEFLSDNAKARKPEADQTPS